jgi:hypothetical protein
MSTLEGMTPAFDPGALLSQSYALTRGPRVRLRLPTRRDEPAIRDLLERVGVREAELKAAQLARVDPRRRVVICAMGLIGATETLLGVGETGLEPELLAGVNTWVDEDRTEGLTELLSSAVVGRATALNRSRAA